MIPQNVNVLAMEPWRIPLVPMMENVHHANLVILEQNVMNAMMDTLKDPMEVVKSVIVHLLVQQTTPVMPMENVFAREDLSMEPNVTNVLQGFSTFQIANVSQFFAQSINFT